MPLRPRIEGFSSGPPLYIAFHSRSPSPSPSRCINVIRERPTFRAGSTLRCLLLSLRHSFRLFPRAINYLRGCPQLGSVQLALVNTHTILGR